MCKQVNRISWLAGVVACAALLLGACGDDDGQTNDNQNNNNVVVDCESDADGDNICDEWEDRATELDTDSDGTPDYLDEDSDNDGIPDSIEGGGTGYPRDSDLDGTPDFRDTDSDDNGILDADDGTEDLDGDGIGAYADTDDDGDGIRDSVEIGGIPSSPVDTDGDGTPDYHDLDSDGDTILDAHEGGGGQADTDEDGRLDYLDLDSDNDGIRDVDEAGDASPDTPPIDSDGDGLANFRDWDSDDDGIPDNEEDANQNGQVDPGETDPTRWDSDGDGVSDLVEQVAGTNPLDDGDNPTENGDFYFLMPYEDTPSPTEDDLAFSTSFQKLDLYILEDVSGSMQEEIDAIKTSLVSTIDSITCGPGEVPSVDYCIPDVETGCGQFGYYLQTWSHLKDINSYHEGTQISLPSIAYGGDEQHLHGLNGTVTGTCYWDSNRLGQACFRTGSLRLIVLISDEDFSEDPWYGQPDQQTVYNLLRTGGVRVIGVTGNDSEGELDPLRTDLINMTAGSPAENLVPEITAIPNTTQCNNLGGSPFHNSRAIVHGPDAQAADAMACAIQAVTAFLPQDVVPELVNDPANQDVNGDPVDAVAAFVDYIEVYQDGTFTCSDGNTVIDSDSDGHPDTFQGILPGTPVCWRLHVKQNDTVEESEDGPQLFIATVNVLGEGSALLDAREVYFLVPRKDTGPVGPN